MPAISRRIPASSQALSAAKRSESAFSSILMHERASRMGPIEQLTGWDPKVAAHSTCIPRMAPRAVKSSAMRRADSISGTFVPWPKGMSKSRWVVPMAIFLLMMEAIIVGRGSMPRGLSASIMLLPTGAKSSFPQAKTPPASETAFFSSSVSISTSQNVDT